MNHLEKAKYLRSGEEGKVYNCAQAILMSFSEDLNMTDEEAESMGEFFGAGMMHGSVCGTISSALMILGKLGYDKKTASEVLRKFRERHDTTQCVNLLTISKNKGIGKKGHCDGLIFEMVKEVDKIISQGK